jgi:hypothetical protein
MFNKSGIGIVTALLTFIIVKVIFSRIGIENISAPVIITLLVVSYIMFIAGVNKKIIGKEKVYFILCASLLAISLIACIVIVILMHYFQQILIEHGVILLVLVAVAMISLGFATFLAITVKRGRV